MFSSLSSFIWGYVLVWFIGLRVIQWKEHELWRLKDSDSNPSFSYVFFGKSFNLCEFTFIFKISHCSFFFLFWWVVFLFPYVPNHWFDSQLHPLFCCFPVNCCLFQLLFLHFWLDLFCVVEVLASFLFLKIYLLIMLLQLTYFPSSLHSILSTPSLLHSPPIVHVYGSYL